MERRYYKTLSKNDTGETGSHQSGISIPKEIVAQNLFPSLSVEEYNPRKTLFFKDDFGKIWEFQYIWYNDLYHGKERHKAHDEYRLTRVNRFLSEYCIKSGDEIWFSKEYDGLHIGYKIVGGYQNNDNPRFVADESSPNINYVEEQEEITIEIKGGWKLIETKL